MDSLLSTKQASEYLGLAEKTLANSRYSGVGISIPFIKIGSSVRYRQSELESYIETNTYSHTSERRGKHVECQ